MRSLLTLVALLTLGTPAAAQAAFEHTVAPGETLTSIAAADGLTVEELAAANGLSVESGLLAGSSLLIPPQSGYAAEPAAPAEGGLEETTAEAPGTGSYVVEPGDTLSAIAARTGLSVEELAAENGLDPEGVLLAGSTIAVPGEAGYTEPAETEETETVGDVSVEGAPYPTEETVSPEEVAQIAESNGVPGSLAAAIADQESGFNNDFVSSSGARGVMQIMPGTWEWISGEAPPPPLAPDSAAENVRGGALVLHALLDETGGDSALAAAGYYQGLSSVEAEGMYPDTEQYVDDVMSLQGQYGG